MAYHAQGHILIDSLKRISLKNLFDQGHIAKGEERSSILVWKTSNGESTARIRIFSLVKEDSGRIILDYQVNGEPVTYAIDLITKPSNLQSGGTVYFMVCPFSGKRCRKIYFNGRYFVHREHIAGMYDIQTLSAVSREREKLFRDFFNSDDLYRELLKKHSKKQYAGKATKRHQKLLKRLQMVRSISADDYERLLIFGRI